MRGGGEKVAWRGDYRRHPRPRSYRRAATYVGQVPWRHGSGGAAAGAAQRQQRGRRETAKGAADAPQPPRQDERPRQQPATPDQKRRGCAVPRAWRAAPRQLRCCSVRSPRERAAPARSINRDALPPCAGPCPGRAQGPDDACMFHPLGAAGVAGRAFRPVGCCTRVVPVGRRRASCCWVAGRARLAFAPVCGPPARVGSRRRDAETAVPAETPAPGAVPAPASDGAAQPPTAAAAAAACGTAAGARARERASAPAIRRQVNVLCPAACSRRGRART